MSPTFPPFQSCSLLQSLDTWVSDACFPCCVLWFHPPTPTSLQASALTCESANRILLGGKGEKIPNFVHPEAHSDMPPLWKVICQLLTTCFNPLRAKSLLYNHVHCTWLQCGCTKVLLTWICWIWQWNLPPNATGGLTFAAATACVQPSVAAYPCLGGWLRRDGP